MTCRGRSTRVTVLLLHPRGGAIMLPPGHFAVKCGCGMVGGCRQPDAPAGTPSSGTHLCALCDRRVVKFSNPTKSNMMQRASAEEASRLRETKGKSIKCPVTASPSEMQAVKKSYLATVKVTAQSGQLRVTNPHLKSSAD